MLCRHSVINERRRPSPTAEPGLGCGTMVCYARSGQEFTFYEIDPTVKRIAEDEQLFTYLSDCGAGSHRIILGDGRRKLAEAPDGHFGLIVLDAFSSDAVPVHLLTREAFVVYLAKLAPHGMLVMHVSNRYLNLKPVVARAAANAGLVALVGHDVQSPRKLRSGRLPSTYVAVARAWSDLEPLRGLPRWRELRPPRSGRLWTDDYSSILPCLKTHHKMPAPPTRRPRPRTRP